VREIDKQVLDAQQHNRPEQPQETAHRIIFSCDVTLQIMRNINKLKQKAVINGSERNNREVVQRGVVIWRDN